MSADAAFRSRLRALLKERSYAEREVTLASGQTSDFYVDVKKTALLAEGHFLLGRVFLAEMLDIERTHAVSFAAVGGMSIGADPLSSSLALTAFLGGRALDAIYVRKEKKAHGTMASLEGATHLAKGAEVIVVEDVVTTGGSTLRAVESLREGGFSVGHAITVVDRQAGGEAALKEAGIALRALFSPADLKAPVGAD